MATRKATTATTTKKTAPNYRAPRRPATKTVKKVAKPSFNPFETVTQVATKGIRFGLGTALLLTENTAKFFSAAMEKGNGVSLTVPTMPTIPTIPTFNSERFEQLRSIPMNQITLVKNSLSELAEKGAKQMSKLTRREKKQEVNIEEEVLNVIATLDLPSKSDLKEFKQRMTELSKRVEKLTQTQTTATA